MRRPVLAGRTWIPPTPQDTTPQRMLAEHERLIADLAECQMVRRFSQLG